MAIDPICGMTVEPETAAGRYDYKGRTYYFCATSCLERFRADPEKALTPGAPNLLTVPTTRKPLPMMMPAAPAAGERDPVCGMTVDPATAAVWWTKAAEQGSPAAQMRLAEAYRKGEWQGISMAGPALKQIEKKKLPADGAVDGTAIPVRSVMGFPLRLSLS